MKKYNDPTSPQRGAVCFTFDDYHGENWLKALPLLKKYDAHVTFFIVGEITPEKLSVMKQLRAAGHSVGLHSLLHGDANGPDGVEAYFEKQVKPQLDICNANNFPIRCFAYPNNRHDDVTDLFFFQYFDYPRAGAGKTKPVPVYPIDSLPEKLVLGGSGIGTYYNSEVSLLKEKLAHAAETDTLLVFFSHDIAPGAEHIHMPLEWLEELLQYARSINLRIVGAEDLATI